MKTLLKCKLTLIVLLLTLVSCSNEPDFSGLCGNWVIADDNARQLETWICDETGARGNAYRVVGADTLFSEKYSLAHFEDLGWVLNISVKGQNQDAYIPFTLTQWDDGMLEFTNPNHDFPNRITYTWHSTDSLKAVVDDGPNGVKKLEFNYRKSQE